MISIDRCDERSLPPGGRPVLDPDDPRRSAVPGYAVRADGTVLYFDRRRRAWTPLKPKTGPNGFRKVRVRRGDRIREMGVALIVLRAFVGPRPLGLGPLHFPDPDPGNNRVENLRWARIGASKVGRTLSGPPPSPRGDGHPWAVLSEAAVPTVRDLYRAGVTYHEIAERFGVAAETIRNVLTGRSWRHVPDPLGPITMRRGPESEESPKAKLNRAEAEEVRGHHAAGLSYARIASLYGVSKPTVRDVVKGRTWKT